MDQFEGFAELLIRHSINLIGADYGRCVNVHLVQNLAAGSYFSFERELSSLESTKSSIRSALANSPRVAWKALRMIGCISSMNPIESIRMNSMLGLLGT